MHLSIKEEGMLEGEEGHVVQKCMKLLVRLGEIYGADEMVKISSAQASGVSYKSIGDPGLEFLRGFAREGGQVRVPTTLNPAGMDLERWEELGFPEGFAKKQKEIINAYRAMSVSITSSCTPYLWGNLPLRGEHLAWAESSAVSFANSVIRAKTNREGGISALAAGIVGRTPMYGLHLDENRHPSVLVKVNCRLKDAAEFSALGNYIGRQVVDGIPTFSGIENAGIDDLKTLGAAMAASGAVALYFPKTTSIEGLEVVEFDESTLRETSEFLNCGSDPDLIAVGCPHASLEEIRTVASLLKGGKVTRETWVCTSRAIKTWADRQGYTAVIEDAGARLVCDTCMVVAPIDEMGFKCTAVNSAKAAHYLPGNCGQKVVFKDLEGLMREAVK